MVRLYILELLTGNDLKGDVQQISFIRENQLAPSQAHIHAQKLYVCYDNQPSLHTHDEFDKNAFLLGA